MILVKQAVDKSMPHKELVDAHIDKVYVFPDKRIDIDCKISDLAVLA